MDEPPDPDLVLGDGHSEMDRRTVIVIATALMVIVIGLGIAFVALSPSRSGGGKTGTRTGINAAENGPKISASPPTPSTLTRDDVVYTATEVPAAGAVHDPGDRDAVRVFAFAAYEANSPQCSAVSPVARVITQDRTSVTIATFAYKSTPPSNGHFACSYLSDSDQPLYTKVPVTLTTALGDRSLVDADTGKNIGIIDPTYVPDATYLPTGYTSGYSISATEDGDLTGRQSYHRGRDSLQIATQSATTILPMGATVGHATVRNDPATIDQQDDQRCISWAPTAGLVDSVCAQSEAGTLLSNAELLKVARSVR